ncbi:MAG: hypothetical protein ABIQ18_00440 [Umezawaea sp.]
MAVVGHAFLKVMPSLAGLGDAVRDEVNRAERNAPRLTIATTVRATELRDQIRAAVREANDQNVTLAAQADTNPAQQDLTRLRREESGRSIDLRVSLDKSLGATLRGLSALDNGVNRTTTTITRHTVTLGAATLRYAALAAAAGQMVTVLGGLGSAAATASGSLLVLPAVGIAAAVAVQTLKLGVDGLSDALKADTPEKYAKAVKDFPPAMRETADAVRALKPELDGLKLDVQTSLFADLGGQVGGLGAIYLPVLRAGLADVASGFNVGARGAVEFAREGRTVDDVRSILDTTGQSVRSLSGGFAPLLAALLDIAAVGSTFLPGFASGLGESAETFARFIATARETGQLQAWMSAGLSALGDLFGLLSNLAQIVFTVFSAANSGGASLLGVLNAVTGSILAFLRSAEGATALQQIFGGLGAVASALLPLISAIAQTLITTLAPAIAVLGPMLAAAFTALIPAIAPLGQILASIAPLLGIAAQALVSMLVPAVAALAPIVAALAPALGTVAGLLGGAVGSAITALTPALIQLAGVLAPLITQLGGLLAQALATIAPLFADLLTALAPIIGVFGGAFVQVLGAVLPILGQLGALLAGVLLAALNAVSPVLPVIVAAISQLAGIITTALATAAPVLTEVATLLGQLLAQAITALVPILAPLIGALLGIVTALLPLLPPLLSLVGTLLPPLTELITALAPVIIEAANVVALLVTAITPLITTIAELLIPIITALLGVVTPVFDSIGSIIAGAMRYIQGVINVVMGIISGDWGRVWTGLQEMLGGIWDMIKGTLRASLDVLIALFVNLPGSILGALGDLGGLLVEAGKNIIRGLLRGIESAFQAVRNKLSELTNLLPDWKGPPAKDRVLLRANGVLIMRSLVTGLQDEEPAVRDYLTNLTRRIPLTLDRSTVDITGGGVAGRRVPESAGGDRPVTGADLAAFTDAVRELASRPVVVQVGTTEIARATAEGNRVLSRR